MVSKRSLLLGLILEVCLAWPAAASAALYGNGLSVAGDGTVYVAGFVEKPELVSGLLLRKYSAAGTLRWTRTYSGSDFAEARGVAVARDGSVYVTGEYYHDPEQRANLLLRKYTPAGGLRWMRSYNHGSSSERGEGVAVARDGSVYVAGSMGDTEGLLLQKYSAAGRLLWMRTYAVANTVTGGHAVAVARDGSVYVVADELREEKSTFLLRKYSPGGVLRWERRYNTPFTLTADGHGVAVARDGSVYATGYTSDWMHGSELFLRKYSPGGSLIWMATYPSSLGFSVAAAPDGSIYVTGTTELRIGNRLLLLKYAPNGSRLWARNDNRSCFGRAVAVALDGGAFVTGQNSVIIDDVVDVGPLLFKFSAAGDPVATGPGADPR